MYPTVKTSCVQYSMKKAVPPRIDIPFRDSDRKLDFVHGLDICISAVLNKVADRYSDALICRFSNRKFVILHRIKTKP